MLYLILKRGKMADSRKRFDPKLYEENDAIAKDFAKNILKGTEFQVIPNIKKRGVDFLVYKDSIHICNLEVEIKRSGWKDKDFPYTDVNFPKRKEKFAILEQPTIFMMLNADQTAYLTVLGEEILRSPCVDVPNRFVYVGEKFYKVPIAKVLFNDLLTMLRSI